MTLLAALTGLAPLAARADALVAVAAPLSGSQRALGDDVRRAAELAVEDLNKMGGVLGQPVQLAAEDDGCDAGRAASTAKTLVERKAALVVGHPCSNAAIAAAAVYGPADLLFIATAARHPALTDRRAGKGIFRLAGRDDRQGIAAAAWLLGVARQDRVALVHDRTRYARSIAESAAKTLSLSGKVDVSVMTLVAGERDYGAIVKELSSINARAVFFAGYPAEAEIIVRKLGDQTPNTAFLASDAMATSEWATALGARSAGVRVLLPSSTPAAGRIPEALRQAMDGRATAARTAMAQTYSAIAIWARAAEQAKSTNPVAVRESLAREAYFETPLGPVRFDAQGDALIPAYAAGRWDGQRWVEP